MKNGWEVRYDAEEDIGYINYRPSSEEPEIHGMQEEIQFQHGPLKVAGGPNGIQNEEFITLLILRVEALDLRIPCSENKDILNGLDAALAACTLRSEKRIAQGVEGTDRPHSSTEEKL